MSAARKRALSIAVMALGLLVSCRPSSGSGGEQRPKLLLLTSLPIMFGEEFSLDSPKSPLLKALEARFEVVPISTSAAGELAKGRLMLMAQPRAQRPQDLVALDRWVRSGGRLVLLADPLLEWPSDRPLGDPLRPPPMFADTGLLGHWGLRLDAPDRRGAALRRLGQGEVITVSPGTLAGGGNCRTSADGLVAACAIGKGRAVVIADADFVDVADLNRSADSNLPAIVEILAQMAGP